MDQALRVFITVVEKLNFTRAAEELHMTQPAVSQYIQTLEQMLGTKLLERSNKYVRLNKAGEIVYHHAQEIVGLYSRMQYLINDLTNTASGNLSIGASYTYGEYILPHIIAKLQQLYPLIKPTITIGNTKEIEQLVVNHQLDIGIVEGALLHKELHIESFAEDLMSIVVAAQHDYANQEDVHLSDWNEQMWIIREPGSGTREATERMFAQWGLNPKNKMEFGSTQIIKESVEAGLGVTLLSHCTVSKEVTLGTLNILKLSGFPVRRSFSFITRATPFYTKAMEVFIQILREDGAN